MTPRRVCFVTGTRAEFGLMRRTLAAVRSHPGLSLQIVATGMHLDPACGRTVTDVAAAGFAVDREVPWPAATSRFEYAAATGTATAGLAEVYAELAPDVVLVVGDRVEAFAAATAAHLAGVAVAHVHGGDRAMGQADDALRHSISRLAHLHLAATRGSGERLVKMGEDEGRVCIVGSPGVDGICDEADPRLPPRLRFALLILHPTEGEATRERERAMTLLRAVLNTGVPRVEVVYPNNDPGAEGIVAAWDDVDDPRVRLHRNLPRPAFLAMLRDAALLAGNSSSGVIEAASFGLPVLDVGPRQAGRERSGNVRHCDWPDVRPAVAELWNGGDVPRWAGGNVYGGDGAAGRIADLLASMPLDPASLRKLIAY